MISEKEAVALALHHSLASTRTSFLAIREEPTAAPDAEGAQPEVPSLYPRPGDVAPFN